MLAIQLASVQKSMALAVEPIRDILPPTLRLDPPAKSLVPILALLEKRSVEEAVVEKRLVVVAEVPVALLKVKF